MLHVISAWCVAQDVHTTAPGLLEHTYWRRFAAQWGDCKKSGIAPLNAIIIIIIIIIITGKAGFNPRPAALNADALPHGHKGGSSEGNWPSLSRGVLHPIQVLRFLVKAANPPTLDVITVFVRVWSPPENIQCGVMSNYCHTRHTMTAVFKSSRPIHTCKSKLLKRSTAHAVCIITGTKQTANDSLCHHLIITLIALDTLQTTATHHEEKGNDKPTEAGYTHSWVPACFKVDTVGVLTYNTTPQKKCYATDIMLRQRHLPMHSSTIFSFAMLLITVFFNNFAFAMLLLNAFFSCLHLQCSRQPHVEITQSNSNFSGSSHTQS